MWVWVKNLWNENLGPQWRLNSNSMLHFFTKMGKMPDMGLEHHIKMDYAHCSKLEKNPFKAKIRPSEYFIWYFMAIFKEKQRLGICSFWLKSAPKSHFIQLFYCTRHFHNKNLPQYAVWGQGIGKTKLCIELWLPL